MIEMTINPPMVWMKAKTDANRGCTVFDDKQVSLWQVSRKRQRVRQSVVITLMVF
jgi:hypothetical protein